MKKILLFVVLPLILSGCASLSYYSPSPSKGVPGKEKELKKAIEQKFNDIPIPEGMVIDAQNSFAFDNGEMRLAQLRYFTRLTPEDLVSFFKRELPLEGWGMVNVVEYGERRLSFTKEKESLEILIYPERRRCKVIISLTPKGGGS